MELKIENTSGSLFASTDISGCIEPKLNLKQSTKHFYSYNVLLTLLKILLYQTILDFFRFRMENDLAIPTKRYFWLVLNWNTNLNIRKYYFFLSKQHICDYQQALTINKTKRKVKCKKRKPSDNFHFQNVDNLIHAQSSSYQTAEF